MGLGMIGICPQGKAGRIQTGVFRAWFSQFGFLGADLVCDIGLLGAITASFGSLDRRVRHRLGA